MCSTCGSTAPIEIRAMRSSENTGVASLALPQWGREAAKTSQRRSHPSWTEKMTGVYRPKSTEEALQTEGTTTCKKLEV